jgi:hypothetical protein
MEESQIFVGRLINASIASRYVSDASNSLHVTAQSKSSYLKIPNIQH